MSQYLHRAHPELRGHSQRASHVLAQPRENEIRLLERDGRRWLEQWRMPLGGQHHQRAWVEVAELGMTGGRTTFA
jgi:hypothetical protein